MPKPGTDEQRPLSIPTLHERALQALVKLVLEPEWEARFEPHSYGFRPGRSVHDAIGAIFIAIEKQPTYALDADIAKGFDRSDQQALLRKIKTFPTLNRLVKAWLQAGVLDNGVFTETTTGTPQGGDATLPTKLQTFFPGSVSLGYGSIRNTTLTSSRGTSTRLTRVRMRSRLPARR